MRTLWFVIPVHGRLELARICLRQLRRTCDSLYENGVDASAVVISDAAALRELDVVGLGFATVIRDNQFLGRKFNDGIQLATDPKLNPLPVDFVVPCGSDDWVDYRLFKDPLPERNSIQCFERVCFVNESGTEICPTLLRWAGGAGIRIIPRELLAPLGYRPCDEDRPRGCDMSMLVNLRRHHGDSLKVKYCDTPAHWIVDWKTPGAQLNHYRSVTYLHRSQGDPFTVLADHYPAEALEEMEQHYFGVKAAVA